MILETIAEHTALRVKKQKTVLPLAQMIEMANHAPNKPPFAFERALLKNDIAFICEVKKASPSKSIIADSFDHLAIAKEYEEAGADCISVLTEPEFFMGCDCYLKEIAQATSIPVIRKDFTIDPYQIYQAKVLGADAVLLICALLDTKTIGEYIKVCDHLSLSALVEAHDEDEIRSALDAGARIIGVNNRNLKTFNVDIQNSLRLRNLVPSHIPFVAESGIQTPEDIRALRNAGVNAVLIGETLMRATNKKEKLEQLKNG